MGAPGLVVALVLALAVRLWLLAHRWGPLWFEEAVPIRWAFGMWGFDHGHFDPDPHSALWPHLSAYYFFAVQALQVLSGLASGAFHSLADFRAAAETDPGALRGAAMVGELALGIASIAVIARLAARLSTPAMGLAVAVALALDPLHIRYSLVPGPDVLETLLVALALLAALRVQAQGFARDSVRAGLATGLGVATKFAPVLLLLPLALAHARAPRDGRRARFALCVAVAAAAFMVATPFTWLDFPRGRGQLGVELGAFLHGAFGLAARPAALTYASSLIPATLGWPLTAMAAVAVAWALWRPTRERQLLLAFGLPYGALLALATDGFARYLLPLFPVLAGLMASAAAEIRPTLARRVALAALATAALAGLLLASAAYVRTATPVDTRARAREWIEGHLPAGTLVALESLGPELADADQRRELASAKGLSDEGRRTLAAGPAFLVTSIPMTVHDADATAPFYALPDYAPFDVVVISSSVRNRYRADRARFPVQNDFYDGLDRFCARVYRTPRDGSVGPEITAYAMDSSRAGALRTWWSERSEAWPAARRSPPLDLLAREQAECAVRFAHRGRFAAAAERWRSALAWSDAPAEWWYLAGLAIGASGDVPGARRAMWTAYAHDSTQREAGVLWAEMAAAAGDWGEAREAVAHLRSRDGLDVDQRRRVTALAEAARRAAP